MEKQNGFTLIELIIVLALIALIFNIAVFPPSIINSNKSHKIIDAFVSDVRYIQQMAIISGKYYALVLEDNGTGIKNSYSIYKGNEITVSTVSNLNRIKTVKWPDGVKAYINIDDPTISFTPRGTLSKGASTILFKIDDDDTQVSINVTTGRVQIK